MTDLINQSMNYEAVYRTAPATPGVLIMRIYMFKMLLNAPGMTENV